MNTIVTGAAGFIGSHLVEALLARGDRVLGVDLFTGFYDEKRKRQHIQSCRQHPKFTLLEADVAAVDWSSYLGGADVVFHQAAQAGVRSSWGDEFETYTHHNILATQRLLESARTFNLHRFVYASSSSVYGNIDQLPARETTRPQPYSPYGVTKLSAEHLCQLYAKNFDVPAVSLRYFTVYGPRQRPDMAFSKFTKALLEDEPVTIYGDGRQSRDFTFVGDIVSANLLAAEKDSIESGTVINIGGGSRVTLLEAVQTLAKVAKREPHLLFDDKHKGDVRHTLADISKAQQLLGYQPETGLEEGLSREVSWYRRQLEGAS